MIIAGTLIIFISLWFAYKGQIWAIPMGTIGGAVFVSPIADWYYYKKLNK